MKDNRIVVRRGKKILVTVAMFVIIAIIASAALLADSGFSPWRILVLRGGDGDVPAVVLLPPSSGQGAIVLHAGGYATARMLPDILKKYGFYSVHLLCVPAMGRNVKNASRLIEHVKVEELLCFVNERSRANWKEMADSIIMNGGHVATASMGKINEMTTISADGWNFEYCRLPENTFKVSAIGYDGMTINMLLSRSGEMEISWKVGEHSESRIFQQCNRPAIDELLMQ